MSNDNATEHYDLFREFARTKYEGCTLEQKLQMYLNHHPIRAVPLLHELIRVHYPEEHHDRNPDTD